MLFRCFLLPFFGRDEDVITKICYFNGMYYVGTYDAGVRVFNPATGSVSTLTQSPLLSNVTVGALAVAPDGNL